MSYKAPVISSIHNRTDNAFGITIQGKVEWLYPRGVTHLYFDAMSACYPKEEAGIIGLISSGKIMVEVLMNCGGTYNSIGFYDISEVAPVVTRARIQSAPVLKSSKDSKDNYAESRFGVKVLDSRQEPSGFTGREAEGADQPTYDPFTERLNANSGQPDVPEVPFEDISKDPGNAGDAADIPEVEPKVKRGRKKSNTTEVE